MKKETYTHITADERDCICALKAAGLSLRNIAQTIGRHHTTISRELKKNAAPVHSGYYLSHKAHERSVKRKSQAHQRDRLKNDLIRRYVELGLSLQWTPEEIAGRLSTDHKGQTISHEAIYQYIYKERRDFIEFLPRHHRKRLKKGHSRKHRNSHIPNRVSIEERPQCVDNRKQEGHWEKDTLVSRESKACLDVSTERKSRYTILDLLEQRTAELSRTSLVNHLNVFPKNWRRSITYDNGSENTLHEEVNRILGTKSYFCHAYASWEKGTVEYTNGLVRRFFPKKTDFSRISIEHVKKVEFLLNTRPRKCLNYKTPVEILLHSGAIKR
jgi:transposase, IS30 family